MAKQTQPTADTLVIEGLIKAGYPVPTSGQKTRATTYFLEQIKLDIWSKARNYKPFLITSYGVTANGVSRYALPADCEQIQSITILSGIFAGTCQAGGSASTPKLSATETISEDTALGRLLLITSGTGLGSASQISAYTAPDASVTPDLDTAPDQTSNYMIIDRYRKLVEKHIDLRDAQINPNRRGTPDFYYPIGQGNADDDETGEFQLSPAPDDLPSQTSTVYGIQLRYYANLTLSDIGGNLMKTL